MSKTPFHITAAKAGNVAEIRIIGYIGWSVDAESFRKEVDALVADGCTEAHLYINSGGGSCFDAEEIVNILHRAFGENITGEGGAIVASAATYISTHCKQFEMPANGQFMVHRPTSYVSGNVHDLRAGLKVLQSIEDNYFNTFSDLAKDKEDFKQKWEQGDNWMTAQEAKDAGFITGVKEAVKIDRETQDMIQACIGDFKINNSNNNNENATMDVKMIAHSLGLPTESTEEQVMAELKSAAKAKAELQDLKNQIAEKQAAEKKARINDALEQAIKEKRISASARPEWEEMLNANLESGLKALNGIQPVKKLSGDINQSITGDFGERVTYNGKTFEELQDSNPEVLKKLMESEPELYDRIYQDFINRNKL